VRSKFSCMRSSHDLCMRAHMHSLEVMDVIIAKLLFCVADQQGDAECCCCSINVA